MGTQRTNIKISLETKDKLKKFGNFGETYEDIILRLIDNQNEEA